MTTWTERDSIGLSARLVACDGHRMPLRGAERAEAIRLMVAAGLGSEVIADRLRTTLPTVHQAARRAGVPIPRPPVDWWVLVAEPSRSAENQARRVASKADHAERREPRAPRPGTEGRRERCTHPARYRQPGGLCGVCGRDEFGEINEMEEAA